MLYELITKELPYLRRYARAMTGDQMAGDLCVEAMLQEHVLKPQPAEAPLPKTRIDLFSLLDSILADPAKLPVTNLSVPAFQNLSSRSRRALFLTAVEQLDSSAVESILKIGPEELANVLKEAERDLASSLATEVLIIEDEAMIAFQLKEIIESLGHNMVARATTREEAVNQARATRPGLMLVDIQLADNSSGLDAMDEIFKFHKVPSIVITAYPERLLSGRENEPAFLIPKPFRADHVKTVISQALLTQAAS